MIPAASASATTDRHSEPVRKTGWSSDDTGPGFAELFATHTTEESSPPFRARPERKRAKADESDPSWVGYERISGQTDYQAPTLPPKPGKEIEDGKSGGAVTRDPKIQSGAAAALQSSTGSEAALNAGSDEGANLQLANEASGEPAPPVDELGMSTDRLTAEGVEPGEEPLQVPELTHERVSTGEVTSRGKEEESQVTEAPTDGTAVAPQDSTMDWAQQQDESAGQEQNLPGAGAPEVRGPSARTNREEPNLVAPGDVNQADALNQPPFLTTEVPLESVDLAARIEMVERIESTIDLATSRMVRSNEHSVTVVLRPEPGTELRMHVRLAGDKIEAAVELQGGDSSVLRSAWPQLQQKLEKQGIHLGELTSSGGFSTSSQDQRRQPPPEPSSSFETFILPACPPRATAPVKSAASTKTHFESWA